MHFDNLGLSDYYFIDPHWLFDIFCQVHTSMINVNHKIDGKSNTFLCYEVFPLLVGTDLFEMFQFNS